MTRSDLNQLLDQLSDRDLAVLTDIERFRLLGARQVQRLHFATSGCESTPRVRAANRALARLRGRDLVRTLDRRVGGVRAGSAGFIYYLGPVGDRLQRHRKGQPAARRRFGEPSRHFVDHTLAIAELAVRTIEASRSSSIEIIALTTEPECWRPFLSPEGITQWLKPDLLLNTADGDYEDHWFIEVDLGSEHLPVILRQCAAYQAYWESGRYQADHGLFPAVVWVTTTDARKEAIRTAIRQQRTLEPAIFRVCTAASYLATITNSPRLEHP